MRAILAIPIAVLTLAGCSHPHTGTAPAAPPVAATSSPRATPAAPRGPLPVGASYTGTGDGVTLAVSVYHIRDVRSHADIVQPSHRFVGADVKVCVTKAAKAVSLSWMPWRIDYADDTEGQPIGEYWNGEFDVPLYPNQQDVAVGRCARGWIMFQSHHGRLATVTYAAQDMEPASWRVPAGVS